MVRTRKRDRVENSGGGGVRIYSTFIVLSCDSEALDQENLTVHGSCKVLVKN